ncbi:hypothetical protein FF1_015845 [Malus domestica]|uniref:Uncharacterized protein n=1 Tax=Malus domestica TaxID=3750 RepID=A0A498I723_MALDO|nr:uncharacterized protein LOC126599953 [Malus sylvestris]RXH77311.1 hypothetical protein DVH24_023585 [Malus domestica]
MDDTRNHNRKRARDDSENSDSSETNHTQPASKLVRVDSSNSVASSHESGTTGEESNNSDVNSGESLTQTPDRGDSDELGIGSAEVKLIQDDLLNILDDSDNVPEIQGLDSVIKSFEEEIQVPAFPASEATSDSGQSTQPELGYLLEASDDELGLPPTNGASEEGKIEAADFTTSGSEAVELDGMVGFENDMIPSYDSFDFGIGGDSEFANNNYIGGVEYLALDGLFDYPGGGVADVSWRTESLSAL